MAQIEFTFGIKVAGELREWTVDAEASGVGGFVEAIADSTTDGAINVAIDVSAVAGFYIVSDQDVTIETNDGDSPDDTLNLKANAPYIWHESSLDSFLLTSDVEALYVTNSSGETANIRCGFVYDATPA